MSVHENLLMPLRARLSRVGRPQRRAERELVADAVRRFGIKAASAGDPVSHLSGGNQQKVVLAKWMLTDPKVLLLDEPTRGVDVGAKAEIYGLLEVAKVAGVAILMSSSEVPELLLLCDLIVVMPRGRVMGSLDRSDASEARIANYAMGGA